MKHAESSRKSFLDCTTLMAILVWVVTLGIPTKSMSQTLSGSLLENETWSGTVVLEGDVIVPAGFTLTIQPGTTIKSEPLQDNNNSGDSGRIELVIDGGILSASGTAESAIKFQSNADIPEPGDWGGIRINDGNVTLKHFTIDDAYISLMLNDSDNRFNEYDISDGVISRSKANGLWMNGEGENARSVAISRLTVQDTFTDLDRNPEPEGVGIYIEGPLELSDSKIIRSARSGIYMDTSDPDVNLTNCEILNSGLDGIHNSDYGSLSVTASKILASGRYGIQSIEGALTLESCEISNNAGGVFCRPWLGNDISIKNCIIENNRGDSDGDGIRIESGNNGTEISILNNTIHNNLRDGIELKTGNDNIPIEIAGNSVTNNNIGVLYRDGLNRVLSFSDNHIANNESAEVHNENNWPIVADGNSWGTALTTELSQSVWNLAQIYDTRDNWYSGQVLIRDWYPQDATSGNPGSLQQFSYQRPGITQIVSGDITDQVVWSGKILVTGDVVVQPGGTLIISAGTEVFFEPLRDTENRYWHSRSELVLEGGNLIVDGTAAQPVHFTSASPEFRPKEDWPGDWTGFQINDGDISMQNFEISFATYSIEFLDDDTRFNGYEINNGIIRNSRVTGVLLYSNADRVQPVTLSNVTIQDTHQDPEWSNDWDGQGIYARAPIELVNCTVTRSVRNGIFADDRAGVTLQGSQIIANGSNGIYCKGTLVNVDSSTISDSASDGIELSNAGLVMSNSTITKNKAHGINAKLNSNDDFNVQSSEISENSNGIIFTGGWTNTDITISGNQIINNSNDGVSLDPGNIESLNFTDTGISGNLISGNKVGLRYKDGLEKVLNVYGNHIAKNTNHEIYNENNWPIVADKNSWGAETTQELSNSKLNLTRIHDTRDDVEVGQVLIRDFYNSSVLGENPGPEQPFDYTRPEVTQIVSGNIEENQNWSGNILVTGDIFIQPSATLTIAPGTRIEFELLRDTNVSGWWLSRSELIINGGNLIANGTADNPIVFTTSSPDSRAPEDYPGDWLGLRLEDGNMTLTHFEIHYAMYGMVITDYDNRFSDIEISDGLITRSNRAGIWVRARGENVQPVAFSRITIEDSEKEDTNSWGHAVYAQGPANFDQLHTLRSELYSIAVSETSVEIENSSIIGSEHNGLWVWDGAISLDNCLVTRNESNGIYAGRSSVSIVNSEFTENLGWGINIDQVGAGEAATLFNNVIEKNSGGAVIEYTSASAGKLSMVKNSIVNNENIGVFLEANSAPLPDEFEFSENTIFGNTNGLVSEYYKGVINVFDCDIFDNRELNIKIDQAGEMKVANSYLGETTASEIAQSKENLTLIYDKIDRSNSGLVTIENLRSTSKQTAPTLRIQPNSAVSSIGGDAEFYGLAEGTPLITYQWYLNDEPISRATESLYRINLVTSSKLGQYHVVATSPHGTVTSSKATLELDLPKTAPTITTQPQGRNMTEGDFLTLTVEASGSQPFSYQWQKNNIAISGATSKSLIIPSAQVADSGNYRVVIANSAGTATSEVAQIIVNPDTSGSGDDHHPADTNEDFRIVIGEITAYGAAWKNGSTWEVEPNPIPINYVTLAGKIWKEGEAYSKNAEITQPPLWWVNSTQNNPRQTTLSQAIRTMEKGLVTLTIIPAPNIKNYAVEEYVPAELTPTNVSHAGTYEKSTNRLRWGPFLDNNPRTISYHIDSGKSTSGTFSGKASFDGSSINIVGENVVSPPPGEQPNISIKSNSKNGFVFTISGTSGETYVVEVSSTLDPGSWQVVDSITLSGSSQSWSDSESTSDQVRFYRVRQN